METNTNKPKLSDSELLSLSQKNPKHFEELVERYRDEFLRKAASILRDREAAKDLVQDTFVRIYIKGKKFIPRQGASFRSWSYAILLNACYSYFKKRKREWAYVSNLTSDDLDMLRSVEDEVEQRFDMSYFLSLLSKLSVSARKILRSAVLEGKTCDDIARMEKIPLATARMRMFRAKREFKSQLLK